jgi:hypothetical protein
MRPQQRWSDPCSGLNSDFLIPARMLNWPAVLARFVGAGLFPSAVA